MPKTNQFPRKHQEPAVNEREVIRRLIDDLCQDDDGGHVNTLVILLMSVGDPKRQPQERESNLLMAITHALSYSDLVKENVSMLFDNPPRLREYVS